MLDSHLHNTCIVVLYDEIFQDVYVNNGTNSNSPRPYFDQYEHGEHFNSNPVFITWVYMPYATLLCTACDIGKIHSWPIRIRIKKLLEKNSFWCRFFFFYEINDINNIYVLLSAAYYSWCYGLVLHLLSFSSSFFHGDDDDTNLLFIVAYVCIPQDMFIIREWWR